MVALPGRSTITFGIQRYHTGGHQLVYSEEKLLRAYQGLFDQVLDMQRTKGLSAAVYTQITDIEGEMNGLMTYDRELIKIPLESLRNIHSQIFEEDE